MSSIRYFKDSTEINKIEDDILDTWYKILGHKRYPKANWIEHFESKVYYIEIDKEEFELLKVSIINWNKHLKSKKVNK